MPGLILALHKSRPRGDFVVAVRVTGAEYPPLDVEKLIAEYLEQGSFTHVWFQEVQVPEQEDEA